MKILRGCIGQGEHLEANVESDWHGGDRGRITHLLHLVPVRIPAAAFRTICSLLMVCSGRLAKKALMWFKLSEREKKKKKAGANTFAFERATCWHSQLVFLR